MRGIRIRVVDQIVQTLGRSLRAFETFRLLRGLDGVGKARDEDRSFEARSENDQRLIVRRDGGAPIP